MQNISKTYEEWLLDSYVDRMSNQHTNQALSWRRLYLSRAKLKASSRTSALLSGFAMVAMVEVQIDQPEGQPPIPDALLVVFGVCTTLLVTVHLMALMISTCIVPNIEAVSNVHNMTAVNESPHEAMRVCIEIAWICSTGIGILLFLGEIAILCWVKFYRISPNAAIASTVIIIPACVLFIAFSLVFYKKLVAHKYERHSEGLRELESLATALHNTPEERRTLGDINNV
ncbi:calcium release-activated calcium channel protein 1-like [Gigantopelta aegis]|uniref:calcium release-activated calcium channel protein 1-like n=1 Tax=Gigantopelta aegis TaxID=1735272 RepID=UPI001B88A75C|nr:calcium release-activated calcium channel protein 1-like [Gigantopelta aegis]